MHNLLPRPYNSFKTQVKQKTAQYMNRLNRDLYSIEETPDGKRIHIFGYAYDADDGTDTPYRMVEFSFNYIPVGLSADEFDKLYDYHLSECKQYISDYDKDSIVELLDNYFNEQPAELGYYSITTDTPCGVYIAD